MKRRCFLTGLAAAPAIPVVAALIGPGAQAGAVGEYSLLIKNESDRVHVNVRMSLNWAGINVQNHNLFSVSVPSGGKFVGRRVSLPGGSVEWKAAKKGNRLDIRGNLRTFNGIRLNKSWNILSVDGEKILKIYD